jgi:hypothetical protein
MLLNGLSTFATDARPRLGAAYKLRINIIINSHVSPSLPAMQTSESAVRFKASPGNLPRKQERAQSYKKTE